MNRVLAESFASWREAVQNARHQASAMERAARFMRNIALSRAWNSWKEFVMMQREVRVCVCVCVTCFYVPTCMCVDMATKMEKGMCVPVCVCVCVCDTVLNSMLCTSQARTRAPLYAMHVCVWLCVHLMHTAERSRVQTLCHVCVWVRVCVCTHAEARCPIPCRTLVVSAHLSRCVVQVA